MPLPDVSRLHSLPASTWRALGERLHAIGFDAESTRPMRELFPTPLRALRQPLQAWRARKQGDRVANALRLFILADAVTEEEAKDVLGDVPAAALVEAGLLLADAGALRCPFQWNFVAQDYAFCDRLEHGGDAAMGAGASTYILAHAALPTSHAPRRALDLGCGAGTIALMLARACPEVVATDVSPRAIVVAKANAMLNGITNISFREGDFFAPVAGETFDVILSQPPFVGQPEGLEPETYLYGGRRGDELVLRVMRELPPFLSDRGRAYLFIEWPIVPGDANIETRIREIAPAEDVDLLSIVGQKVDLDEHCMTYATFRHPALDESYARAVVAWRDHLEAVGMTELRVALHVFARAPAGRRGFTSTVPVRSFGETLLGEAHVDRWMAARDLASRVTEAILDAKLVITPGMSFAAEGSGTGKLIATPPAESLSEPVGINPATRALLEHVHRAAKVKDAARSLSAETKTPLEAAEAKVATGVAQALLLGLLEPAPRSL